MQHKRSEGGDVRGRTLIRAFLAMLWLSCAAFGAQGSLQEEGGFPLRGRVYDRMSQPVAGAEVVVDDGAESSLRFVSDQRGRFWFSGLSPGRWTVVVRKPGFLDSMGFLVVPRSSELEIELRLVDDALPTIVSSHPEPAVLELLESGNRLFFAGRTSEAREQYQKAIPSLGGEARAAVSSLVARTLFVEGDVVRAAGVMAEALNHDPNDPVLLELFDRLKVLSNRRSDRSHDGGELRTWSSTSAATSDRTGYQTIRFETAAPAIDLRVLQDRIDVNEVKARATLGEYDLSQETFELFVPNSYRRGGAYGLIVWISPSDNGRFWRSEIASLLEEKKLLFVGANNAGNKRPYLERAALAIEARSALTQLYDVDRERIYLAGYSGGGRVSSMVLFHFPELFRGGIFWFGANHYDRVEVPYRPGSYWPVWFKRPSRQSSRLLRQGARMVYVTGDRDFNRSQIRAISRMVEKDGYDAMYLQIPNADHYGGLEAEWFKRALEFVER